jgi:16S rRNA G966 N2-methylase RsmD
VPAKPSALVDTRVIYCGDNLDQLRKLPDGCVDLIYIDPPFNSNRSHEVFWGETKEKRSFQGRHESTKAYIDYMRPRCVELHRVLKDQTLRALHTDLVGKLYREFDPQRPKGTIPKEIERWLTDKGLA